MFEKNILEVGSVDSTNSYSERLTEKKKVPEGTIIWAKEQTSGKGQGENRWLSDPGENLTFSMILFPSFLPADQQFFLNMAVSLGILDFLKSMVPGKLFKIKWPNDIYHHYLKLGGILINNILSGSVFDLSIIGIGININQTEFDPSLPNPGSLRQVILKETDLKTALVKLAGHLEMRYNELKAGQTARLQHEYLDNLLGYNKVRKFKTDQGIAEGMIRNVDPFGRLVLEIPGKGELLFAHKEIDYVLE